jgi:hypothetical protein
LNRRPFELGKNTHHAEHALAAGRCRVQALLMQEHIEFDQWSAYHSRGVGPGLTTTPKQTGFRRNSVEQTQLRNKLRYSVVLNALVSEQPIISGGQRSHMADAFQANCGDRK